MCTVTFIPRRKGYCLGMNRDENRARAQALPPAKRNIYHRLVLYPSEPNGGTWIALSDMGVSFALINWYSVQDRVKTPAISRGIVIPSVASTESPASVDASLSKLPLGRLNPFRLVGIFPGSQEIAEWRWDLKRFTCKRHKWHAQQWISSGFDELQAQKERSRSFRQKLEQKSAGTLGWLRRLHRSHAPHPGPFSTCMHRADAATVSYTEILVSHRKVAMHYVRGSPCSQNGVRSSALDIDQSMNKQEGSRVGLKPLSSEALTTIGSAGWTHSSEPKVEASTVGLETQSEPGGGCSKAYWSSSLTSFFRR
jgi:hypothetical protein